MATEDKDVEEKEEEETSEKIVEEPKEVVRVGEDVEKGAVPTQLGAMRYVLAGFFASGIAVAYVVGRILSTIWNLLAESQTVVDKAPWLSRLGEDDRNTWGTLAGAIVGLFIILYIYRRDDIRTWVNEAAAELSKVTWPNKKEVTNGTIVVVIASLIATFYLAVLDRFWGFVTDLVYRV